LESLHDGYKELTNPVAKSEKKWSTY